MKKDSRTNTIYTSDDKLHDLLCSDTITVDNFHWILDVNLIPTLKDRQLWSVIRSTDKIGVKTKLISYDHNGSCVFKILDGEFHWAASPGQYLALYDEDFCFGGGRISNKA